MVRHILRLTRTPGPSILDNAFKTQNKPQFHFTAYYCNLYVGSSGLIDLIFSAALLNMLCLQMVLECIPHYISDAVYIYSSVIIVAFSVLRIIFLKMHNFTLLLALDTL